MFKNLSVKIFALFLAILFWFFVVSLENTFSRFPDEVQIQVFNQAQDLALASKLGGVHLAIRVQDPVTLRNLSAADFEAYVDLRNVGAGTRRTSVFVTSKNPQVSVVKVDPSEVEVTLEPLRDRTVTLKADVVGQPFKGYKVQSVQLSRETISVQAADSVLKKISQVKAEVKLDGTEDAKITKPVTIKFFDAENVLLDGIKIATVEPVEAAVTIVENESTREVGIRPVLVGSVTNGVVKNVQVDPGVTSLSGPRELLDKISSVSTEPIDLKDATGTFEKTVKLNLPPGVTLAKGQKVDVRVKIEIEKSVVPPAVPAAGN